jgi:hypothetical protein
MKYIKHIKLYEEFLIENQLDNEMIFKHKQTMDTYLDMRDFFRSKLGDEYDNVAKQEKLFDKAKTQTIKVDAIIPNQDYLRMDQVRRNQTKTLKKKPLGVKFPDGNVILFDGHHRIAGEIIKGTQEVEMKILNA